MIRFVAMLFIFTNIQSVMALERITPEDSPIIVYSTDEDFETVKELIDLGITDQGLIITTTLHISAMYERTAADLGFTEQLYEKAEAYEFCSVSVSYAMSQAHPANLSICPLTIGFYQPYGEKIVYLSFTNPKMLGDSEKAENMLRTLYENIIREALD